MTSSAALIFALGADWKFKSHASSGQLSVHVTVGIQSVVNTASLLLVQNDLEQLAAVLLGAESLADDLDWVHNIAEDGFVDSGQCAGSGSLLGLCGSASVAALWSREDAALSKEDDVTIGELLLEFTGQALLDLVESLEERNWDKDDDCLLAMANLDLTRRSKLQWSELGLQVCSVALEVVKGLGDLLLEFRRLSPRWAVVCDLVDGCHVCD